MRWSWVSAPFRWLWGTFVLLWLAFVRVRRASRPTAGPREPGMEWSTVPEAPMDPVDRERFERAVRVHRAREDARRRSKALEELARREAGSVRDVRRDGWTR